MLNIGKLRRGGENYYLNSVARGVEDYYLGSGEAPGYWLASGAADLGLSGEVGDDELRNVLRGSHPISGTQLVKPNRAERVPGFDLTFRAPKSVALLHELGSEKARDEVVKAHDAAVAAALGYLERQASGARRGHAGKQTIASEGFIAAAFRHRTSRAGDPLLHTHVLTANLIKGEDGKWGALDAQHLYRQAKTAGYLYQAQLRVELTRRLGVDWTPVHKGAADIEGISRSVIRGFSTRRKEIEALLAGRSEPTRREAEVAALTTRHAKDYKVSPQSLEPEWRERAERLGLTREVLDATLDRAIYKAPESWQLSDIGNKLAAPEGLTAQQSAFSRREALQGFCSGLEGGGEVQDIEVIADGFLASDLVIPLTARSEGVTDHESRRVAEGSNESRSERRYSTVDMLTVEQTVIERAIERRLEGAGVAAVGATEASLARRPTLYPDQGAMVTRLTTSGQGVEVVVGKAGAGKTFALDAAREAWELSGYRVVGCARSARAAQELQAGSGIQSYTIASLLIDLDHPRHGGLRPDSVLVVDEGSMVGTRDLERLLAHAQQARVKVVLVGDDRQLPEIEAGGAFRGIKNRLPAIELSEVRRQPDGWQREALDLIREGKAKEAIMEYSKRGRVHVGASAEETRRQLVADWWATQVEDEPAVMIAARRSDVADLNARARQILVGHGLLGQDAVEFAGQSFSVGDRVMTLKNTRRLGVINGTRALVEAIDLERGEITIRRDDDTRVTLPHSYLDAGHLTHAYAITGHKAQGMTTENAFVLGDETLYREWAYVAMSRGKQNNSLYVVSGVDPERDEVGGEVAKIADPTAELIRALGRSRAKELAIDVYEQSDIRNLTMTELRKEWESIGDNLGEVPPDPTEELKRVSAERARVESLIEHERNFALRAKHELNEMNFLARRRDRAGTSELELRIADASEMEARLESDREGLLLRADELESGSREREQWLLENAPSVRRRFALERELWWREHQSALAAEVAMPTYLSRAVGHKPDKPSERAAWQEAVSAIESYRSRWGVTDRGSALGDEAAGDVQKIERDELSERLADRGHEPVVEHEVEIMERSIER